MPRRLLAALVIVVLYFESFTLLIFPPREEKRISASGFFTVWVEPLVGMGSAPAKVTVSFCFVA